MMKKIFSTCALLFLIFNIFGQTEELYRRIREDNVNALLTHSTELKEQLNQLKIQGEHNSDTVQMFEKLLSSKLFLAQEEYSKYVNFVEELYEEYQEHEWLRREYSKGLALSYYYLNLFDQANEWNKIYRKLNEGVVDADGRINLDYVQPGLFYYRSGNYEKALQEFLANYLSVKDDERVYNYYKGNITNNVAITLTRLDRLDSAELFIEKAREYWSANTPKVTKDRNYLMGLLDGNLASIEVKRGNYIRAKNLIQKDIKYSKERDFMNYLNSKSQLVEICLSLNQLKEAEQIFQSLEEEVNGVYLLKNQQEFLLKAKYLLLKAQGKHEEALKVHEEYMEFKLSHYNDSQTEKREQIAVLYDLMENENTLKKQEIEILKTVGVKEENKRLTTIVISLVIIGSLLVLLLFLILQLKNRKINREKEQQQLAKESEEFKDLMMREMHHRIKNNLQTVSGLFRMQLRRTKNEETTEILKKAISRVNSITEIHNLVFEDDLENGIRLDKYIKKILLKINELFPNNIDVNLNVEELYITDEQSVPVGLIINELMTNSMKYAFENVENPRIDVDIIKKKTKIVLRYADNGEGYTTPESQDGGLGLTLIDLMAKQLKASVHYLEPTRNRVEFIFE